MHSSSNHNSNTYYYPPQAKQVQKRTYYSKPPKKKSKFLWLKILLGIFIFGVIRGIFYENSSAPTASEKDNRSSVSTEAESETENRKFSFITTETETDSEAETDTSHDPISPDTSDTVSSEGTTGTVEPEDYVFDPGILPGYLTCYYYRHASTAQQKAYYAIYQALCKEEAQVSISGFSPDEAVEIFYMVMEDRPELFWVKFSLSYIDYTDSTTLIFSYSHTGSDRASLQTQIEANTAAVLSQAQVLSDYERHKLIFTWLADTVTYTKDSPDSQTIVSSLVNHESVCSGYTRAMQYLLQRLGIEALYVSGYTIKPDREGGAHAWVISSINGQYYHSDPTWGDPDKDYDVVTPELYYDFSYLCVPDDFIMQSRYYDPDPNIKSVTPPCCSSRDLLYFVTQGRYYDEPTGKIFEDIDAAILSGSTYFVGQFSSESAYLQFTEYYENSDYSFPKRVRALTDYSSKGKYCFYSASHVVAFWLIDG